MAPPRASAPTEVGRSPPHPLPAETRLGQTDESRLTPPRQVTGLLCQPKPSSRLPRRRPRDITSCRQRARGRKCPCSRPQLLSVSVTCVHGPGCCLQLGRRYGSPGVLSLAQPQVPVHHCQLRGREGEGEPGDRRARTQNPGAPRPRPSGPAACSWGLVLGSAPMCRPRGQLRRHTRRDARTRFRGSGRAARAG